MDGKMNYRSEIRMRFLPALISIMLLASSASAQTAPALPELNSKRLLNELQVIVAAPPRAGDGLTISLVVRYGATYDPSDRGGLANLVSRMFFRASLDRTRKDLQDELSLLGATVDIACDWDGIRFSLRGQGVAIERSLLLLYQAVGEAIFTEEDLAQVKAEILQQIEGPADPRQRIRVQFENALFRGTSYGRPLGGTAASVRNISIGDVRLFYRRYFSPGAATLVVVSSAQPQLVLQRSARIWGVWVKKDEVPFTFVPPTVPAARTIMAEDDPASPAAQFILGSLWPRRDDPAFYAATLAARILQERLTKALPTSLLTVAAEGRRMPGPFYVQGQAAADQTVDEIRKILDAVEKLKNAPVTSEELAEAQKRWVEEFKSRLETPEGVCSVILDSELYRLGTNYAASFSELVQSFDPDAVQAAAKEWMLPGGVIILVRGSMAALKEPLGTLGTVQPIK
jgi:zinc protease